MKPGRMIARLSPLRERFDAVLLDLDGTLLSPWEKITSRGERAVRALGEAGFQVHLCTGRSFAGIGHDAGQGQWYHRTVKTGRTSRPVMGPAAEPRVVGELW